MPLDVHLAKISIDISMPQLNLHPRHLQKHAFEPCSQLGNFTPWLGLFPKIVRCARQDMDFTSKDKVLRLLEQAAASLDGSTGEDLGPAFKRYRQAVFKLNYKINKLNAAKRGAAKVRVRGRSTVQSVAAYGGVLLKTAVQSVLT